MQLMQNEYMLRDYNQLQRKLCRSTELLFVGNKFLPGTEDPLSESEAAGSFDVVFLSALSNLRISPLDYQCQRSFEQYGYATRGECREKRIICMGMQSSVHVTFFCSIGIV